MRSSWIYLVEQMGAAQDPSYSVQAGGPNGQQQIQAVATDPNGRTISGMVTVWMYSGCVDEHGDPVDQC